jgi:ferredoxin
VQDDPATRHAVRLEPSGWSFEADATQPLLVAAHAAGIALPVSCRNGTCRSCIARLVAGRIDYRIEWPGLSAEEKAEGWILPCVAHARSELVIEAPGARRPADAKP